MPTHEEAAAAWKWFRPKFGPLVDEIVNAAAADLTDQVRRRRLMQTARGLWAWCAMLVERLGIRPEEFEIFDYPDAPPAAIASGRVVKEAIGWARAVATRPKDLALHRELLEDFLHAAEVVRLFV